MWVKETYDKLDMVTATWNVQRTPADNAHDGVWQYKEKKNIFYYIPVLEFFFNHAYGKWEWKSNSNVLNFNFGRSTLFYAGKQHLANIKLIYSVPKST